jgi:hypothetical protein
MAPEMVSSHIYTEKVDVFSLAVMLFEALRGRLNVMRIALDGDPKAVVAYAQKVANGFREPLPRHWPHAVTSLIEDAWHQVRLNVVAQCGGDQSCLYGPATAQTTCCGCQLRHPCATAAPKKHACMAHFTALKEEECAET